MQELESTGLSREEILYDDGRVNKKNQFFLPNIERNPIITRPILPAFKNKENGKRDADQIRGELYCRKNHSHSFKTKYWA